MSCAVSDPYRTSPLARRTLNRVSQKRTRFSVPPFPKGENTSSGSRDTWENAEFTAGYN